MADLNLIPENCQRCEDEESITAKAVIPPHPASSYVETYVGRAVPTGQYRIDRPSGPLTSLYDKGGPSELLYGKPFLNSLTYCYRGELLRYTPLSGDSTLMRQLKYDRQLKRDSC